MLDFSASKGVDLAREQGGPGQGTRWTWPAKVGLAAAGKAEGKKCPLLSNSNHGYYENGPEK